MLLHWELNSESYQSRLSKNYMFKDYAWFLFLHIWLVKQSDNTSYLSFKLKNLQYE